ncbi:T7SS effector LXG polymorphic toxin [Enterococcus faecium]|uniref:LXG domain-containing protein n=1 Tax=Enterococcus faecium TaxID=1352 RepID=A0A242BEZ8_ENTFC|nr:T7SS effector LXG polymorphic toxin [Enterococcus faecium]OTN93991.1 hypothetical protein A5810_001870 [Enterococcus faecium]
MGLIYSSKDASTLKSSLSANLSIARTTISQLNVGSQQLIAAIDGHTLSGAAYNAGKGLFSDLILPTIKRVSSAIDTIQQELNQFSAANSFIASEGYLDEENLQQQLTILQRSKASLENAAHTVGALANIPLPTIAEMLRNQQQDFLRRAESYQRDIVRIQKKLNQLKEFDAKTKHLFTSSLKELELAMQAVMVLNNTTVNSDGTYVLPKGIDNNYFSMLKKNSYPKQALRNITEKIDYGHIVGETTLGVLKEYAKDSKVKAIKLGSRTVSNYSFSRITRYAKSLESVSDDLLDSVKTVSNNRIWKGIGIVGTVAGVAFDYDDQMSKYKDVGRATKNTVAHTVIGAGGSVAGAYIGGIIGSAVPIPGIGTVAGALAGAYIGKVGEGIYDWVETGQAKQDFDNTSNTVFSGINSLKNEFGKVFAGFGQTLGSVFG